MASEPQKNPFEKLNPKGKRLARAATDPLVSKEPLRELTETPSELMGTFAQPPRKSDLSNARDAILVTLATPEEVAALEVFTDTYQACALECGCINSLVNKLDKEADKLSPELQNLLTLFKIQHAYVRDMWRKQTEKFETKIRLPLEKRVVEEELRRRRNG